MALSGSVSTNNYDGRYYTLSWSATQSIANNQSTISWTLSCAGGDSWYAERTLYAVIAGVVVANKTDRVQRYGGNISSGSFVVNHDAAGNFGFTASIQAAVYYSAVNCTGSASFGLDTIPRQATLTYAPDFHDESNPIISYSNPAGTAVTSLQACISFVGDKDDIAYRDIDKTGSTYMFALSDAERDVLRKNTLSSNSRTVIFYVRTLIGGVYYHSVAPRTFTVINCAPTLSPIVEDLGSASYVLTQNRDKLIRYFNYPQATFNAVAKKGASIVSRTVTCGSQTLTASGDYTQFNNVDSNVFTFTIRDNRGNTATETISKDMVDYITPSCYIGINKDLNPDNTASITLNIAGDYYQGSFGAVDNTLTVEYRYKNKTAEYPTDEYGNEIWNTVEASVSGITYAATTIIENIDYKDTYTIQTRVKDKIYTGGVAAKDEIVKIVPTFDWGENDFNFNVPVHSKGGFTYDIPVKYNSDVDMMLTSGKYYIGTEAINKPGNGHNGWLEVMCYGDGNYCYQKYFTYTGDKYERWRNEGVWGSWTYIDYIIEEGVSGIWYYKKWHSGFAEIYGRDKQTVTISAPAGSVYRHLGVSFQLPFKLTKLYVIESSVSGDNVAISPSQTYCDDANNYVVVDVLSGQPSTTPVRFNISVKGTWK